MKSTSGVERPERRGGVGRLLIFRPHSSAVDLVLARRGERGEREKGKGGFT